MRFFRYETCSKSDVALTFRYLFSFFAVGLLMQGCSDDPGSLTGGQADSGDPGPVPTEPLGDASTTPPASTSFGELAVSRARLWVRAKMPYCGGPNGGRDVICGGTCKRGGTAENKEWDDFRSDCSGFVSWAWNLDAPGRTTSSLAPYDSEESDLIDVDELEPGDALNSGHHVMLFAGWTDKAKLKATILQETECGTVASEVVSSFTKMGPTTLKISDGRIFRSIRYKKS